MKIFASMKTVIAKVWLSENYIYLLGVVALALSASVGFLVVAHFQFGWDLWIFSMKHVDTAQYWGQVGDFVGGILNPLLSFCALMAVLYNLSLQREELALARKDAKEAQRIQNNQSIIFETQNFESVFFRLLDVHSKLADSVRVSRKFGDGSVGYEAFSYVTKRYFSLLPRSDRINLSDEERRARVRTSAQTFIDEEVGGFGHYFRNIYQILKYVDGLGQSAAGDSNKHPVGVEVGRIVPYYRRQRDYANMLRAQLSEDEVTCLYLNCLSRQGAGLKYYVEKYSMLKTADVSIRFTPFLRHMFFNLAYAGYEDLEFPDLISLVIANDLRKVKAASSVE
ncbi:putative phage abortive infection protein [Pseudomonas viridiflava]|uniref:putative phage abortive infection protein n=1 Tax=Pseudomonas viridiflava TaxID=33069 RepID=UPI000F065B5B|nr:putative phage abortive infection protein [Pseudomonas viridiflava]